MPILDNCLSNIFEPGFIPASSGTIPRPPRLPVVEPILTEDGEEILTEDGALILTEG